MERAAIEGLIRRWVDSIETGDDRWDELLCDDVRDLTTEPPAHGAASFRARAEGVRRAFVGIVMTVDAIFVDGDRVAWR